MSQQTTGRAALALSNLPSSSGLTVTNATNASPIVVTAAAHGLQPNEIVFVTGVTGNAAANGIFVVGSVTTNTFTILTYPAGANTTGNGAYVAGGAALSLGWGNTVPIPTDLTDLMRAGSVNVPFEAILDRLAYLMWYRRTAISAASLIGNTLTAESVTGDGALHDSANNTLTIPNCNVNDTIVGWLSGAYTTTNAGLIKLSCYDQFGGGGQTLSDLCVLTIPGAGGTAAAFSIFGAHNVGAAGTCKLLLRYQATNAVGLTINSTTGETSHGGNLMVVRLASGS